MKRFLFRFAKWLTRHTRPRLEPWNGTRESSIHNGRYFLPDDVNSSARLFVVQFESDVQLRDVMENLDCTVVDVVHEFPGYRLCSFPDQLYWEEK